MTIENTTTGVRRRDFVAGGAAAALAASAVPRVHGAIDDTIKVGIVGCGGRGTGAGRDSLDADPNVKLIAMADVFDDRLQGSLKSISGKHGDRVDVPKERQFVGFDAYRQLIDGVPELDYVIFATPPFFRAEQVLYAAKAGKNVFSEKPVAVDPAGCRTYMEAGKVIGTKGLSLVAGTQRRHQNSYLEVVDRIRDGAIGDIVAGQVYWNMGQLWHKDRQKGWSDMEWMIRDWVNWSWLSGDHIVEQHVHNIDVANWFKDAYPVAAVGMGGRAHRPTGDQYDFFAVDFEYADGSHVASYCRQINGCANNVSENLVGTKGTAGGGRISGENPYEFKGGGRRRGRNSGGAADLPYVQEHADLIASIRGDGPKLNEAMNVATSTLTAIMGRTAAYTGKRVTWDEMMSSDMRLGPQFTEVTMDTPMPEPTVPVQGQA